MPGEIFNIFTLFSPDRRQSSLVGLNSLRLTGGLLSRLGP
jgi:hypothetical protein